jgi:hypothetical protein
MIQEGVRCPDPQTEVGSPEEIRAHRSTDGDDLMASLR